MKALLIGKEPPGCMGHTYVTAPPYDAVMIGSLTIGQLLCFSEERVLEALAEGLPVLLYTPGLPQVPKNRALGAALSSVQRQLKAWGVVFTDGSQKKLITAQEAKLLRAAGKMPGPGAVLTPLAREILEGNQ